MVFYLLWLIEPDFKATDLEVLFKVFLPLFLLSLPHLYPSPVHEPCIYAAHGKNLDRCVNIPCAADFEREVAVH